MTEPSPENSEPLEVAELISEGSGSTPLPPPISQATPEHQVFQTTFARGEIVAATAVDSPLAFTPPPPIPEDMDNVSAVGGAVGALVLGIWSIVGSFLSPWSVVNSGLGILLGIWGLTSRYRRWATVGIILCIVGFVLSSIQIGELLKMLFETDEFES